MMGCIGIPARPLTARNSGSSHSSSYKTASTFAISAPVNALSFPNRPM